jgi:hypothetical protein
MYAGSTFHTKSGRIMGVHQRIDRVARRHIVNRVPRAIRFPLIKDILHFEGVNGPDGLKRKSPGKDEPWHFIDPYHEGPHDLLTMIDDHIHNLATALKNENYERSSYEAAWLAHAVTDGLTPAHHYPLEEKLEELRGEGMDTRNTRKDKILMPGTNRRDQIRNNWEFWGAKGVMTTHLAFEFGVATAVAPLRFDEAVPTDAEFQAVEEKGYEETYKRILVEIADMNMYTEFARLGWTRHLANETKRTLVPLMIKAVVLAWYQAILLAQDAE